MFGNNDICNFGKHKGKSWYDIANSRNFGYLEWIMNNIAVDPLCLDHINSVIETKFDLIQNNNLNWKKEEVPIDNGNIKRTYKLEMDEKTFESPVLELRYCVSCNYLNALNHYTLDQEQKICNRCCSIRCENGQLNKNVEGINENELPKIDSQKPLIHQYEPKQKDQKTFPWINNNNKKNNTSHFNSQPYNRFSKQNSSYQ